MQADYGKLPLHFEANQGQTDKQVKFLSRGSGYTLFLTPTEAVLALRKPAQRDTETRRHGDVGTIAASSPRPRLGGEGQGEGAVLRMKLVGANPNAQIVGLDELPGKSNYFLGNDPKNWRTNVSTYARVQYREIYPGIDLIYYGNQRQLEYDFVIAPGADPKAIQLAFDGLVGAHGRAPVQIDAQGDLVLHTEGEEIRLHKPRIYQEINGVKHPIPGGYVFLGPETPARQDTETRRHGDMASQNPRVAPSPRPRVIGFEVAAYDTTKPLIIDLTLSYSTYLGGSD